MGLAELCISCRFSKACYWLCGARPEEEDDGRGEVYGIALCPDIQPLLLFLRYLPAHASSRALSTHSPPTHKIQIIQALTRTTSRREARRYQRQRRRLLSRRKIRTPRPSTRSEARPKKRGLWRPLQDEDRPPMPVPSSLRISSVQRR